MARGTGVACASAGKTRAHPRGLALVADVTPEEGTFASIYAQLGKALREQESPDLIERLRVRLIFGLAVDRRSQPDELTLSAIERRFPTHAPLAVTAAPGMPSVLHLHELDSQHTLCGHTIDEDGWQEMPDSFWRRPTTALWSSCPRCNPPGGVGPGQREIENVEERQAQTAGRIANRLDEMVAQGAVLGELELLALAKREAFTVVHERIADRLLGGGESVAELILGDQAVSWRAEASRVCGRETLGGMLGRDDWLLLLRGWSDDLNDAHLQEAFGFAVQARLADAATAAVA